MRTLPLVLLLMLSASGISSAQERRSYVAAIFSRGTGWDTTRAASEQPHFAFHGMNLKRLKEEGRIAFGARYGELGMVVFRSASVGEVRSFFTEDSLVLKEILHMELTPFHPFYTGCVE